MGPEQGKENGFQPDEEAKRPEKPNQDSPEGLPEFNHPNDLFAFLFSRVAGEPTRWIPERIQTEADEFEPNGGDTPKEE